MKTLVSETFTSFHLNTVYCVIALYMTNDPHQDTHRRKEVFVSFWLDVWTYISGISASKI